MQQRLRQLLGTRPYRRIIIFTLPVAALILLFIVGFVCEGSQQFSDLAQAFLRGQLNFLQWIGGVGQDPVLYNGKIYWDDGPFPSILLMPFVGFFDYFHLFFYQGYLKWLLMLGIIYFIYKLARLLKYSKEDSWILMFGFILGSVFIGVASVSSSWLFAQVVTTFLLFWGLYEFFTRKRWWLLGLICGILIMTRVTAAPILIFFALEAWFDANKTQRQRVKVLLQICWPVAAAFILLGLYNFARFHNPLQAGNKYQLIAPASAEARSLGIFSLAHIPTNFYNMFLSAPRTIFRDSTSWTLKFPYIESNPYGMSIFITSPYLLYLFTKKWSAFSTQARHLIIAILASCLFVLAYYGDGIDQFGYRYSLDFLPEVFLLFMILYRHHNTRLSRGMKFLLLAAGIVNFWLVWSFIL